MASLQSRKRQARQLLQRTAHLKPNPRGYVRSWFSGRNHYVHRLVMEVLLGRRLCRSEHVHHRDGIRHHNQPGNLQLLSPAAHNVITHARYPLLGFCLWCHAPFRARHGQRPGARQRFCSHSCAGRSRYHHARNGRPAPSRGARASRPLYGPPDL